MMTAFMTAIQMQSWHDRGLYMGMHWLWWIFWIFAALILAWGLASLVSDRAETRRGADRSRAAEEELRTRYARGEIDEDEFIHRMNVLRDTAVGG